MPKCQVNDIVTRLVWLRQRVPVVMLLLRYDVHAAVASRKPRSQDGRAK